ncbi:MAG: class II fructose-bisphosphate aldolase [Eisenbergiella sp.]
MAIVSVKEILEHAWGHKYGVPAINVFNYETVKWAIEAAEEERLPIIIQFYPGFAEHIALKYVADFAVDMAKKARVPVAVHLDHSPYMKSRWEGSGTAFLPSWWMVRYCPMKKMWSSPVRW